MSLISSMLKFNKKGVNMKDLLLLKKAKLAIEKLSKERESNA